MSEITIRDGGGSGRSAKVRTSGRLDCFSIEREEFSDRAADGFSYLISSGEVTLTSANESTLLYINNTGDKELVLKNIFFRYGASTGGSGTFETHVYFEPTGGTTFSNENNGDVVNLRVGDPRAISALVYKGAEGETLTGQRNKFSVPDSSLTTQLIYEFILPPGTAIGFGYTPPTGNTSQIVAVVCRAFEREGNQ